MKNNSKQILILLIIAIFLLISSIGMSAIGMKQRAEIKEILQNDSRIYK